MKRKADKTTAREMRVEYDFSHGVRGKWAKRSAEATNVVILAPDIAKVFRTSKQVNDALRALVGIIEEQRPRRGKSTAR